MIRLVLIIVLIVVAYIVLRRFVRMLKQGMHQKSERRDYQYQKSGCSDAEEEYRKTLGITSTDDPAIIKTRYRELLTKYHPDKVQHLGVEFREMAEMKTKAIMEAYEYFQKKYNL